MPLTLKRGRVRTTLEEATAKELLQGVDPEFISHQQRTAITRKMGVQYQGVRGDTVRFKAKASEPGKTYDQTIKLLDFKKIMADRSKPLRQRVRDAVLGNIKVHCTGNAYLFWGYQFVLTKMGAALKPENRAPKVRNPNRKGTVCKHLDAVLKAFPFWISNIVGELKKQGYE